VNDLYRDRKAEAAGAFEKRNWSTYIFLHEGPHRLHALTECIRFGLSGPEYWSLVGDVWVDSENIHQNLQEWRRVWRSQEPGREKCMNDDERAVLASLPDLVQVWRGTAYQKSIRGISWTTIRDKAKWFAKRFSHGGLVAEATVAKKDIKAVFLERKESEVVSLRVKIEQVTSIPH
jgi:hypothetical protein